jgi:hypothetical protein
MKEYLINLIHVPEVRHGIQLAGSPDIPFLVLYLTLEIAGRIGARIA